MSTLATGGIGSSYDGTMLILFDIDGTLLLTHGAGMQAMQDAGRELYHPRFSIAGADYSGRLDPLIWKQLCEMNGVMFHGTSRDHLGAMGKAALPVHARSSAFDPRASEALAHGTPIATADDDHTRFRRAYEKHLRRRLDNGARVTLLPGVRELLETLRAIKCATLGLVTGNYPETGRLKIDRAGIDYSMFTVFGWGCDGAHRRDLPAAAMHQFHTRHARSIPPEDVIIIGDTPRDIDCAHHNGCRAIAVATGAFSLNELRAHSPDLAVENLSDTVSLVGFMSGS